MKIRMNTKDYLIYNLEKLNSTLWNIEAFILMQEGLVENSTISNETFTHRMKSDFYNIEGYSSDLILHLHDNSWMPRQINTDLKNIKSGIKKLKKYTDLKFPRNRRINKSQKIIYQIKSHIFSIQQILKQQ